MVRFYSMATRMAVLTLLLFAGTTLSAATIVVTSPDDSGSGTLREAVDTAQAGDIIEFNLVDTSMIFLQSTIVISKDLSILGQGMQETMISGGFTTRVFQITQGVTVEIANLTIQDGFTEGSGGGIQNMAGANLTLTGVMITGCIAQGPMGTEGGGGLHNMGTALVRGSSRIMGNSATGASGSGGGILNNGSGTLTLNGAFVMSNTANRAGGGIEDASGTPSVVTVIGSTISGNRVNTSPGNGGGIHVGSDGNTVIRSSTFENNSAGAEGGALWNGNGTMDIGANTLINNNVGEGDASNMGGGGIFQNEGSGTLVVRRGVRITNNRATGAAGSGGGILADEGTTMRITGVMFSGNVANRAGGAIEDNTGSSTTATLINNMFIDNIVNTSPGNGGAIHITGPGNMNIAGGMVRGNSGGSEGGGLWNGSGTMNVSNIMIVDNVALGEASDNGGGGIFNNGGTLNVTGGTVIRNNTATAGQGSGGGIFNAMGGTLFVSGATINSNEANRAGGGIEDASGSGSMVTIASSRIDSNVVNTSPGNGGGIHVGGDGSMTVRGSFVTNNEAGSEGGGLWNNTGTMTVVDSRVMNNVALGPDADTGGGGLYNNGGTMVVTRTRVMNNSATGTSGSGGGLLSTGGAVTVTGSTFTGNYANRAGGAVEQIDGEFTSQFSLYSENVAGDGDAANPGNGGAFHVSGMGATVAFTGDIVRNNSAALEGGGLWNQSGETTMTVTRALIENNTALGDDADTGGGGLFNNGGTLTVDRTRILNNSATGTSGSGGGILSTGGAVTVTGSRISGNEANRAGGGVEQIDGSFASTNSLYTANIAGMGDDANPGNGGAFHVSGMSSTVSFSGDLVQSNVAALEGGGLWNQSGTTMTLTGVRINSNTGQGNDADTGGGGLFNNGGTLMVMNSRVTNNVATGTSGSGGGLLTTGGDVTVMNSIFGGNRAVRAGGGVEQIDGSFTSTNSDYVGNRAVGNPGSGGAFHVSGMESTVAFTGGNVRNNRASNTGGGLWNQAGTTMTVTDVSVMANSAQNNGGGIWNNGGELIVNTSLVANNLTSGNTGGVYSAGPMASARITTSTITGNDAAGVFDASSSDIGTIVMGSTVAMNGVGLSASSMGDGMVSAMGTIVALNGDDIDNDASVFSNGFNLVGDTDNGSFGGSDDIIGGTPDLQALADNGGPTMTHAIDCTSDAVDAWTGGMGPDQRGEAVFGDNRDIGAFELQTPCGVVTRPLADVDTDTQAPATVLNAFPNPVSGNFVNVRIPESNEGQTTLRLIDQSGRFLGERSTLANGGTFRFPLMDVPAGLYTLQAINGDNMSVVRLIVQK